MSYGITSTSQIIDLPTILNGCAAYKRALNDFEKCGSTVMTAGQTCSKEALSVDESTLEYPITDLGQAIKNLKDEYSGYADEVAAQANKVYAEQVAEYNAYLASLKAKEQENNNK